MAFRDCRHGQEHVSSDALRGPMARTDPRAGTAPAGTCARWRRSPLLSRKDSDVCFRRPAPEDRMAGWAIEEYTGCGNESSRLDGRNLGSFIGAGVAIVRHATAPP